MSARLRAAMALLKSAKQKVAVAESSAGGKIASLLLAQPGASGYFAGGVVCYTKIAKRNMLGLEDEKSKPTATKPHAVELAQAAAARLDADWGIGETGACAASNPFEYSTFFMMPLSAEVFSHFAPIDSYFAPDFCVLCRRRRPVVQFARHRAWRLRHCRRRSRRHRPLGDALSRRPAWRARCLRTGTKD